MNGFLSELKRRNVIRMAGLYLVGAWLLTQVAATLLPVFEAPGWVMKTLVGILAVGFIPAMIFAWIFELTPDGLKRDAEVMPEESIAPQTARRMERLIIALFAFALIFFGVDKFVLAPKREAVLVTEAVQASKNAKPAVGDKSIAVMPFVNMSSDKEQEYFSDGMTEEILNALANVPNLAVTARTSVFSLKGQNKDVREIGKLLGVAYVLEGSVRKADGKVRITAQLIRTDNGFHLWSETYDRKLENVFDLQAELASAIAKALELPLGMGGDAALVSERSNDPQAYALYLQARSAYRERGEAVKKSIELYREALKRDPKFAPAWAGLASSLTVQQFYLSENEKQILPQLMMEAEAAGKQALALSPDLLSAHIALGGLYSNQWRWALAEQHFKQALALNPTDPEFYFVYTDWLYSTGKINEALQSAKKAVELDPLAPMPKNLYGYLLFYAGRNEEAIAQIEAGYALAPNVIYFSRNLIGPYLAAGRIDDAEKAFKNFINVLIANGASVNVIDTAKRLNQAFSIVARDPAQYDSQRKSLGENGSTLAFLFPAHTDDLFINLGQQIDAHTSGADPVILLRSPYFDGHRKDPRYIRLLNKVGFDDEGNIR